MSDAIVVNIDLESNSKAEFDKIQQQAKATGEQVGLNVEKAINKSVGSADLVIRDLNDTLFATAKILIATPPIGKGLFGTVSKLGFSSLAISELAGYIEQLDNKTARATASFLKLISVLTGGLTAALTIAISKTASFVKETGTNLVESFKQVAKKSNDAKQSLDVLNGVIDNYNIVTNGAIGLTSDWSNQISLISDRLNISSKELNKSAQEIILVGSQLGFTSDQLQKILEVSSDYAKVNRKKLFPTTLAIVKGLSGSADAAQALGIKLTESAASSFALKKGLSSNFSALKDNEKAQIRYSKLLSQYNGIAGLSDIVSGSLSDQQNALTVSTEKVANAFGDGVSKIENLNLVSFAANKIVKQLDLDFVSLTGTVSAIGARFLQASGFIVEWGLNIFFVTKALTLLKSLLDLNVTSVAILTSKIPLLNKSFSELITFASRGKISLISLSGALTTLRSSLVSVLSFFGLVSSTGGKAFSIFASLKEIVFKLFSSIGVLKSALVPLLIPFTKIIAIVGLIVGGIKVLISAFSELEKRTSVFSTTYNLILNEFSRTSSILQPVIDLFVSFRDTVIDISQRAFGLLVAGISKVVSLVADIIASNPFGVFSQQTVDSFGVMKMQLDAFNASLADSGYKLGEFATDSNRKIASMKEPFKEVSKEVGQFSKNFSQTIENGVVDIAADGMARLGASLNQGASAWSGFASQVLNIIGDMAINLGKALVAKGLAIDALKTALSTLSGGVAVAAGLGLIALGGLLKSFGGGLTDAAKPSGGGLAAAGADGAKETAVIEQKEIERQNPSTNVEVVVQGSLVQQEELGTFIAETLSNSFGKQGVSLTDARFV